MNDLLAGIIIAAWAFALLMSIIGLITDDENVKSFADIIAWAAAGLGCGCAIAHFVNKHDTEQPKQEIAIEQKADTTKTCVTVDGTKYCGLMHIENEKQIIDITPDGVTNVQVK